MKGGYVTGSLKSLIAAGEEQPNPKEDGDAPAHQDAAGVHRAERSPRATDRSGTGPHSGP